MPVSMSGTPARGRAAAFGGTASRFVAPNASAGSTSYDTTHGTMGAAVKSKSVGKSSGSFGGGAGRSDMGMWGVKVATPRGEDARPRSEETAQLPSAFGAKPVAHKGPSAAFGGGKDRFAVKKAAAGSEYVPAGMGAVKKTHAKSSLMGGGRDRFAPVKAAEGGDYSGAYVSDFSTKASSKSFNKSVQGGKGKGFGGTVPRVSAMAEQAARAAREGGADAAYDISTTGAFAAVAKKSKKPSAAFASKSTKETAVKLDMGGDPGLYDAYGGSSMGQASKSFNKSINSGAGGFGTTAVRDTGANIATAAEYTPGPGAYTAAKSTAFGASASVSTAGSAAFASSTALDSRNATIDVTDAPSGPAYDAHLADSMAVAAAKSHNKSSSGTMGKSKRMADVVEAAPGDYTLPTAFGASKSASTLSNVGFGGTASRSDAFEAKEAAPGDFYLGQGAFDLKSTGGVSAAFKSKSERGNSVKLNEVGDPGAYNPYDNTTLAAQTSKSFNKSLQNGAGGFGVGAKRSELTLVNDAPGPGAYDATDGLFEKADHTPSAAFASTSEARPSEKLGSAPDVDYDAVAADGLGLAAAASRTFNRSSMSGAGGFGAQLPRTLHAKPNDAPGPGEYSLSDPLSEANLRKTRDKESGGFASGALRDSDDWLTMFNK